MKRLTTLGGDGLEGEARPFAGNGTVMIIKPPASFAKELWAPKRPKDATGLDTGR
jgi:hypothetical protein